jgi:hypothetical protein
MEKTALHPREPMVIKRIQTELSVKIYASSNLSQESNADFNVHGKIMKPRFHRHDNPKNFAQGLSGQPLCVIMVMERKGQQ